MDNQETKNELDQPSEVNAVPASTQDIIAPFEAAGLAPAEAERRKKWVTQQMMKLEAEAWEHETEAAYGLATAIPPVEQNIEQNRIAIERHQAIIAKLQDSKKREDRDARRASEQDIKLLQANTKKSQDFIKQLREIAASRRSKADEVKLRMAYIARQHAALFGFGK